MLLLAVIVAGCAAGQRADQKRAAEAAAAHSVPPEETSVVDAAPAVEPAPERTAPEVETEPAPPVARTEPIDDNPGQVMGLDTPAVDALLGRPRLRRVENPAEVWQYAGANCVMDLFLYPSNDGANDHRVTYFEIRGTREGQVDRRACFRAILMDAARAG